MKPMKRKPKRERDRKELKRLRREVRVLLDRNKKQRDSIIGPQRKTKGRS